MNIQKITKIALLTALVALTGSQCWGATEVDVDADGNTALNIAAWQGDQAAVKALLDRGAFVDHVNYEGETPLISAMRGGRRRRGGAEVYFIAKMLLDAGADVNHKDNNNKTVYYHFERYEYNTGGDGSMWAHTLQELLQEFIAAADTEKGG